MDISCSICNLRLESKYELYTHSYVHKTNQLDKCDDANVVKCDENTPISKFTCGTCKKTFDRHAWYIRHINGHCMASYECFVCCKTFGHIQNLKKHFQLHTNETKFNCKICNKGFYRQDKLLRHERTHSTGFFCGVCAKSFMTKKELKLHRNCHNSDMFYHCQVCSKKYRRKHSLTSHMFTHTGESRFNCKYCKRAFGNASHAKRHETLHKFDPVSSQCFCLICGGQYDADVIVEHVGDAHAGSAQFVCDICHKTFEKRGNLLFHLTTHKCD